MKESICDPQSQSYAIYAKAKVIVIRIKLSINGYLCISDVLEICQEKIHTVHRIQYFLIIFLMTQFLFV